MNRHNVLLLFVGLLLGILVFSGGIRPSYAQTTMLETHTHIVRPGETLSEIALIYDISPAVLAQLNQLTTLARLFPGQSLAVPDLSGEDIAELTPATAVHLVQWGETVNQIAYQYNLDPAILLALNKLNDPDLIYAGQRLQLTGEITDVVPSTATPNPTPIPAPTPQPTPTKHIVVDLSEQRAYAYENDDLWRTFVVSTGQAGLETATGTFAIQNKIPVAHAYTWNLEMPYWLGIYWAGNLQNGFHALPVRADGSLLWDGYLGTPVSYGCIILSTVDAETLYHWAEVGTPVTIQP